MVNTNVTSNAVLESSTFTQSCKFKLPSPASSPITFKIHIPERSRADRNCSHQKPTSENPNNKLPRSRPLRDAQQLYIYQPKTATTYHSQNTIQIALQGGGAQV